MSVKYIGLDVHQATTVAAVRDDHGKLLMECIVETKAASLLSFLRGVDGEIHLPIRCWKNAAILTHTCCDRTS